MMSLDHQLSTENASNHGKRNAMRKHIPNICIKERLLLIMRLSSVSFFSFFLILFVLLFFFPSCFIFWCLNNEYGGIQFFTLLYVSRRVLYCYWFGLGWIKDSFSQLFFQELIIIYCQQLYSFHEKYIYIYIFIVLIGIRAVLVVSELVLWYHTNVYIFHHHNWVARNFDLFLWVSKEPDWLFTDK